MNTVKKYPTRLPAALLALSPALLWVPSAQASSSFNSSAALSYTINSITNLTNPGSLLGLALSRSFELAAAPDYAVALTGNGAVYGNNPGIGSVPISPVLPGAAFNHSFAVSGSVGNGTVNTSQLGLFGLNFENTGSDHYQISLTLNYQLDTAAGGQLAGSAVDLDYFNEANSFAGFDHIEASAFTLGHAELIGSSGIFNFTLPPGAAEALYADVRITGNLEASPVPLPASFWLLFAGLSGIVSLGKGRRKPA